MGSQEMPGGSWQRGQSCCSYWRCPSSSFFLKKHIPCYRQSPSNFTVVHRVSALKWHLCFTDPVKVSWGAEPQVLQTGTRACRLWVSEMRKMKAMRVRPGIPLLQGREGTVEKRGFGLCSTPYAPYTGDRRKASAPRVWTKKGKQIWKI